MAGFEVSIEAATSRRARDRSRRRAPARRG